MDRIMEQLRAYCPWNEQEEADCAELLRRLHGGTNESSTVTSAVGAGVLTVTLRAECLEDIAEETEIVP